MQKLKNANPGWSNSDIARRLGKSRVRITQMLNLLKLSPTIQNKVLNTPLHEVQYTERQLRPLTFIQDAETQEKIFEKLSQF